MTQEDLSGSVELAQTPLSAAEQAALQGLARVWTRGSDEQSIDFGSLNFYEQR